jgi:hypothetical protein
MRGRAEETGMSCLMVGVIVLLVTWLPGSFSGVGSTERAMHESWKRNPDARATRVGRKFDRAFRIAFNALGVSLVLVGVLQSWA